MKLFFGIPTSGAPTQPFLESLGGLSLPDDVGSIERAVVSGNFVPAQRELLAERAVDAGADVLIMCDDDMIVPHDAFLYLLDDLRKNERCGLAGALYYSRDGFRPMAVDRWTGENTTTAHVPGFEHEPIAVDGVGFGCVAVRMAALAHLTRPWFPAHVYVEKRENRVRVCNEDYLFCARLRDAGWNVILDPRVRAGHFDRASGTIAPRAWEPPERTRAPRIAVVRDGVPELAEWSELPAGFERHERATLTYVRPD